MKLDVLSGFEKIEICTAYELDGVKITEYPVSPGDLKRVWSLIDKVAKDRPAEAGGTGIARSSQ